ncbi:MAG: NAD(P)H-dependent oxidoreductase subunit E [Bacteroidales bacterium]|jgi:[NiFe] hydrogenase diaphorase moiety large subunit|nr:NAD(P)H-dependent oxidoreductase subunit E [Bacteroidales bacterium]
MESKIKAIIAKYSHDRTRLMDILHDVKDEFGCISPEAAGLIAGLLKTSQADVEQTISFYHFYSMKPAGKYAVYLNNSAVACMMGRDEIAKTFEKETGIPFNSVTPDGLIGLWDTSDIGMNDQEPAAIINDVVFTRLTPSKVREIVTVMKSGQPIQELVVKYGDGENSHPLIKSMVHNNIMKKGPVLFSEYELGMAIRKAVNLTPELVIDEVKRSNLRGRGGAGFPAGLKWEFCRKSRGAVTYLLCNADEGEPGTFKERVILTELPKQLFEGMVVAGYALGAKEGVLYLRYEYRYLVAYLEQMLQEMRDGNLLGRNIAGKQGFNYDIRIQLGAGAYVCGEESALIESMEGKRGEPRNRPPFPVQKGYLDMPTVINNVETLSAVVKIMVKGADWFKAMGTKESAGTKLLSVSGDCKHPGVYEIEWGTTIRELLEMVGATSVQAVQVGGPSGVCINPTQFHREIAFEDLATGGSMIIIGKQRNLLKEVVVNFMDFFIEESCSSCVPCRSLTVILKNKLQKILDGKGSRLDVNELYEWTKYMKAANRCGLGQTAANPVLSTIENFRQLYDDLVIPEEEFVSTFNLEAAVADSCAYVGRIPKFEHH